MDYHNSCITNTHSLYFTFFFPCFYLNIWLWENEKQGRQTKENEKKTDGRLSDVFSHFVLFGSFFLPPCSLICFLLHFNNCPRSCYPFPSMFSHPPLLLSSHPHPSFPAFAFWYGVYVKPSFLEKWLDFVFTVWVAYRWMFICWSHKTFCSALYLYFRCVLSFFMKLRSLSC